MIRLNLPTAPHDLDLGHGVAVTVMPLTTATMAAVRAEMVRSGIDATESDDAKGRAFVFACARVAVQAWTGVGDEEGQPIAPTPDRVDSLMNLFQFYDRFNEAYVLPRLLLEEEKKDFAPLPDGTLEAARNIATDVPIQTGPELAQTAQTD